MTARELLKWQWEGYPRYHQSRANLALHVAVVPLFLAGNIIAVISLVTQSWPGVLLGVALTLFSVLAQGRGHKREPVPPEPFTSPANAISRIFLEQWVTFPRFVATGGWAKNWRSASGA